MSLDRDASAANFFCNTPHATIELLRCQVKVQAMPTLQPPHFARLGATNLYWSGILQPTDGIANVIPFTGHERTIHGFPALSESVERDLQLQR